jgi:hypothetical protein
VRNGIKSANSTTRCMCFMGFTFDFEWPRQFQNATEIKNKRSVLMKQKIPISSASIT